MIPRNVDWSVLAQCDYFAVENLVQTAERPAMRTINPISESIFQIKLSREGKWRETYDAVCSAYRNLGPSFQIDHDNFGGYRLLYKGKQVIHPPSVFKRNPVGFVASVPDGVATNLSVMSSERTGNQLLLLGPMRFVNSDCSPNCEYDFTSDSGIVQLRVKRKITPGDEILVKYGPDFFEFNACRCRTCEVKKKQDVNNEVIFDLLLQDILEDLATEELDEEQNTSPSSTSLANFPKRKCIRGRELVEVFNEMASSPMSNHGSPPAFSHFLESSFRNVLNQDFASISQSNISINTLSDLEEEEEGEEVNGNSSPIEESSCISETSNSLSISESSVISVALEEPEPQTNDPNSFLSTSSTSHYSNQFTENLFEGSGLSVEKTQSLMGLFCSHYNLSDECSSTLHTLIKALLPDDNKFPSSYSHIRNMKQNFLDEVQCLEKRPNNSLCVMKFRLQLRDIIQRNLNSIFKYSEKREQNQFSDFPTTLCPLVKRNGDSKVFNLLLFSDGVSIKKSTSKKDLWPLWVQIGDLPPRLRVSRQNVVLAALNVGPSHPDWKVLVPKIKGELISGISISQGSAISFQAFFKFRLLVSDLGAKSHMLNMFKFNGFYGCHYCTAPGETIGKTHAYYPYGDEGQTRETVVNELYVDCAETIGEDGPVNVVGVKGRSAFADIVDGLPLTAPVDYMHCVLLGVFPEVLKLCYKALSTENKIKINIVVSNLSCPREMIAYSRKIRSLEDIAHFKANEYFNWLFYLSPVIFLDRLPNNLYSHLMNLVLGLKLLFESSSEANVNHANFFLDKFCREIVDVHEGHARIETINVHCIRHLADQVRRFGPLYCYSAMSFEAANRTLSDVYTGSHSECEIICRRVLQRHKLAATECNDPKLRSLFGKLTGNKDLASGNFDSDFLYTDALKMGKTQYPNGKFFNRQVLDNVYFDSSSYKRGKQGNCFVYFMRGETETFGQIQYFIQLPGQPFYDEVLANVRMFAITEKIGAVEGFFYRVEPTSIEDLIPLEDLKKVLWLADLSDKTSGYASKNFVIKLCSSVEHS